jgi:hypothetical protein
MPVTIDAQDLRVRSLDVDFHEVSWALAPTTEDILDYTFQLLRSEAPEGPYEPLTVEMEDIYLFVDNVIRRDHIHVRLYYRLRIKHKSSGDIKEFGPVAQDPDPDLIATELRKHMNLLFREFIGRRCWVMPVRTFGQRCTNCYNVITGKRRSSGCYSCFDTSFVRGYHNPIEAWVSIDPPAKTEQNTSIGPLQTQVTTARMGYWPPLKIRDILIESENIRWRVTQVNQTEQLRAAVHQEIQIHRIPPSDIEYKIELNLGAALKDLWLGPSRNFTNPHNLENFKNEEIPDIFSMYPTTYPNQR